MTLTLTSLQRDLLYDQLLDRLSGIGDIWLAIDAEDFERADRLGREFIEDLTLISDDLGWGEGNRDPVELTTPPEILRRALSRHCDLALKRDANEVLERRELTIAKERNEAIVKACRDVMAELDRTGQQGAARLHTP
jgi:hypothetical protein